MTQKRQLGTWDANDFTNPDVHMPSVAFATDLVDKLGDGGVEGVTFTGGGEPSAFLGLEDVMMHTHDQGIDSVLFTNGFWEDPQRIDKVLESRPKLIRISLNAGTERVHDRFHHPLDDKPAFATVIQSIERFARGALANQETSVGVSVVINAVNADDLVEVAYRVREIVDMTGGGIAFLAYRPMFNNRPCKRVDGAYVKTNQLHSASLDRVFRAVEDQARPVLEGTGVSVSNVTSRFSALKDWQDADYFRFYDSCRATGLFAELSPNGELHLCCDWNCDPNFAIGDLTNSTLEEVWQGAQRKRLIQRINDSQCEICPPACKPHDSNKQFAQVEMLRAAGELYKAEIWIHAQLKAERPKMANF